MGIRTNYNRPLEFIHQKVIKFSELFSSFDMPLEQGTTNHYSNWVGDKKDLENANFALVATYLQTSAIGERRSVSFFTPLTKIGPKTTSVHGYKRNIRLTSRYHHLGGAA